MKDIKSFLGTGWSFPPRFDEEQSSITMVSEEEDIKESIFLLLSTTPGERITNPKYGCDLRKFVFRPINAETQFLIKEAIKKAILYYEPRINVNEIEFDTSKERDGVVNIHLEYTIVSVNTRTNIVFPFYKVEGTDIKEE